MNTHDVKVAFETTDEDIERLRASRPDRAAVWTLELQALRELFYANKMTAPDWYAFGFIQAECATLASVA